MVTGIFKSKDFSCLDYMLSELKATKCVDLEANKLKILIE
jgi:hypothetical protein